MGGESIGGGGLMGHFMELKDAALYVGGAFIIVLLIFIAALVARSLSGGIRGRRGQRLSVSEFYDIDKARRLILVRRDGLEHLVLIGPNQDVVIERGISPIGANFSLGDDAPLLRRPQRMPAAATESENTELPPRPVATRMAPRPAVFSERAPNLRPIDPDGPRISAVRGNNDDD